MTMSRAAAWGLFCLMFTTTCSAPTPCKSSAVCSGATRCINGTCQDPKGCSPETQEQFCRRTAKECGAVALEDNCGALRNEMCGTCPGALVCNEGLCEQCRAEADSELCKTGKAECGQTVVSDKCGSLRSVQCGDCTTPKFCGGGGSVNLCGGCKPEIDEEFCASNGRDCGSYTGTDRCGQMRTALCGTCGEGKTCRGGGTANVCGCNAEDDGTFCYRIGKNCGEVTAKDNCATSRTVNCGSCVHPAMCGGNGTPANICSGCKPETDQQFCVRKGKNCGSVTSDDNCGQSRTAVCGMCSFPDSCSGGGIDGKCGCLQESDVSFCARLKATCDTQTAPDNCGVVRTRSCGTCAAPKTCGGGGDPKNCGCPSETDAELCARHGKTCGSPSLVDKCGTVRTPTCGPSCDTGSGGGNGGTGGGSTGMGGGTGTGGGSGAGGDGGGAGTGGGSGTGGGNTTVGCASDRQKFSTVFQGINSTSTGSTPEWSFRCVGEIIDGGFGVGGVGCVSSQTGKSPIELQYHGDGIYELLEGPLAYGWTTTPVDTEFKIPASDTRSGTHFFCEAMGYAPVQTKTSDWGFVSTSSNYAVIQVKPLVWGTAKSSNFSSDMKVPKTIQCGCPP